MSPHKKLRRCKAKAKSGKPCQAKPAPGGLCFFHANPDKAAELGRIGGRTNRYASGANADSVPTLDTAIAVRDTVAQLIADVRAGRIPPRTASSLATLLSLQLRAIDSMAIAKLERRFDKLENPSAEAEDPLDLETRPLETPDGDLPILIIHDVERRRQRPRRVGRENSLTLESSC